MLEAAILVNRCEWWNIKQTVKKEKTWGLAKFFLHRFPSLAPIIWVDFNITACWGKLTLEGSTGIINTLRPMSQRHGSSAVIDVTSNLRTVSLHTVAPERIWKCVEAEPPVLCKSGEALVRREALEKILVVPLYFLALKVVFCCKSRFGERFRDGQYSLVSFLFAVLLIMLPPCPAICKGGARVPRAPWSRRHWSSYLIPTI